MYWVPETMRTLMSEVQLRPATAADIAAILAVTKAAYASHAGRLDPPSGVVREQPEAVERYLNDGGVIVAEVDGQIVGAVRYEPRDDHLYLGRLAVAPAWQRQGIGRRLVEAVEEWALLLGLDEVHLGVRMELTEYHDLYRRLGYVDNGTAPFKHDERYHYLKMKKRVRSDA